MKAHYAEEIIFSLAVVISLLSFEFGHPIVGTAFVLKAVMDFICIFIAIKEDENDNG
jgi:hypothetical protein